MYECGILESLIMEAYSSTLKTTVAEQITPLIPKKAILTVVYANVSDSSYTIEFWSQFDDGTMKQSNDMAERDLIDGFAMEKAFDVVANAIRSDSKYKSGQQNVYTFTIKGNSVNMSVDYFKSSDSAYRIKKDWKLSHVK